MSNIGLMYIQGRFYVLNDKAIGGKGYSVRDHMGRVIYNFRRRSDAVEACNRLNIADTGKNRAPEERK